VAVKKPLVITAGQVQQLQAGDSIEHPGLFNRTNNNAGAITIGQAVYVDGAGTVDLAQADAAATTKVLGLVADVSIAAAASGGITTDGVLTATTGQWDAVTGQVGGLTAGSQYWLSAATAGALTTTAPTATGEYVAPVGVAMSTTELEITIGHTILL
jgi:hypothetical protein